jgi:alpha-glucosidase
MPDTTIPRDRVLDPVGLLFDGNYGRDPERTPMQWDATATGGFSTPGVEPWLPYGDAGAFNVEDQRRDPSSMLSLARDLVGLRDAIPELRDGDYATIATDDPNVWAWRRGGRVVVACNLSDADATVDGVHGVIRACTDRGREDEVVEGRLTLPAWTATIVFAADGAL